MPFTVGGDIGAFGVFVLFILGCVFGIEETHKRAVGYERNNAVGFVMKILQTADPYENNEDGYADNFSPKPFRPDATVSRVINFSFMLFLFMGLTF